MNFKNTPTCDADQPTHQSIGTSGVSQHESLLIYVSQLFGEYNVHF